MMEDDVDSMHESRKALRNSVLFMTLLLNFIASVCCFSTKTHRYFSDNGAERALVLSFGEERRGATKLRQHGSADRPITSHS